MVDINTKVAGLPYWGWGVAIVGGIGVAYVVNKNQSAPEGAQTYDDPYSYEGTAQTADYPYPGGGAVYVPGGPAQSVDTSGSDYGPLDNAAWEREALLALMEIGYPPLAAQQALSKFLTNRELTEEQREMIDRALRAVGPTPDPVDVPDSDPEQPNTNPPTTNPQTIPYQDNVKWGAGVPDRIKKPSDTRISPFKVKRAMLQLGMKPGNYIQGSEIKQAFRKVGMSTNKIDTPQVVEMISRASSQYVGS